MKFVNFLLYFFFGFFGIILFLLKKYNFFKKL